MPQDPDNTYILSDLPTDSDALDFAPYVRRWPRSFVRRPRRRR